VAVQERALAVGQIILLETRPVDPRDLLRGDYVILNYKISNIPTNRFSPLPTNALPYGQTVWVALAPRGEFQEIVCASTECFDPGAGEILLKAKANGWGAGWNASPEVRVVYGLERYYIREDTGNSHGRITVQAVVPASSQASIKQVFLDGKP